MKLDEKSLSKPDDLLGKTIVNACYGNGTLLLRFSDGTYAVLGPDTDDEEASVQFEPACDHDLRDLGIITHEEYCARLATLRSARENAERVEYERLKAKYEPLTHGAKS